MQPYLYPFFGCRSVEQPTLETPSTCLVLVVDDSFLALVFGVAIQSGEIWSRGSQSVEPSVRPVGPLSLILGHTFVYRLPRYPLLDSIGQSAGSRFVC
jgi:hypothetical protein